MKPRHIGQITTPKYTKTKCKKATMIELAARGKLSPEQMKSLNKHAVIKEAILLLREGNMNEREGSKLLELLT